jgi:N-acetylmuramate 1-kinase
MQNWVHSFFPHATKIQAISQEASTRSFYRLVINQNSFVLMVYPEPSPEEISRITRLTPIYIHTGLHVPKIYENIENRALLQEDLGDHYYQYYFKRAKKSEKFSLVNQAFDMAIKISSIPAIETNLLHDKTRQKFEMDFFLEYFLSSYVNLDQKEQFRHALLALIHETSQPVSFAHRDFHSRNIIFSSTKHGLVDFQDSLRAHPYYDLASFFWDAYLPWTEKLRSQILNSIQHRIKIDINELETVALQRTIKALGTFAYQIKVRGKTAYSRYMNRVILSTINNPQFSRFFSTSLVPLFSFRTDSCSIP